MMSSKVTQNYMVNNLDGTKWEIDEVIKILQADQRSEKIQSEIDALVEGILNCPLVSEAYPTLASYTSDFRKIDIKKKVSPEMETVKNIISAINKSESVKVNFKKLGEIHFKVSCSFLEKNSDIASDPVRILQLLIVFAKDNQENLMIPSLYQSFFHLDRLPDIVTEKMLNEKMAEMDELSKIISQRMLNLYNRTEINEKFFVSIDRIVRLAVRSLNFDLELKEDLNPLGFGLNITAICSSIMEKKRIKSLLNTSFLEETIKENKEMEKIAHDFLNDANPKTIFEKSVQFLNEDTLSTLPIAVRLKAFKSLTESDPNFSKFFKKKTMKFVNSLLRDNSKIKLEEPPEECLIQ